MSKNKMNSFPFLVSVLSAVFLFYLFYSVLNFPVFTDIYVTLYSDFFCLFLISVCVEWSGARMSNHKFLVSKTLVFHPQPLREVTVWYSLSVVNFINSCVTILSLFEDDKLIFSIYGSASVFCFAQHIMSN